MLLTTSSDLTEEIPHPSHATQSTVSAIQFMRRPTACLCAFNAEEIVTASTLVTSDLPGSVPNQAGLLYLLSDMHRGAKEFATQHKLARHNTHLAIGWALFLVPAGHGS